MALELIFLGTGTSAGIPMIGCACETCTSTDPRDSRTRASVLVRYPDPDEPAEGRRQYLIDTATEMRSQVVRHRINRIDGVLFTHAHADHVFGMDDLRRFNAVMNQPIDIYAESHTLSTISRMFQYVFDAKLNVNGGFIPQLIKQTIEAGRPFELHHATWTPLRLMHGRLPILGYRVDYGQQSLAYCTDVSSLPPETYPMLADLDVLVIDALRYRHHPTHMTIDQALEVIDRVKPTRAYLTHMAHDVRHAELESQLPRHVFLSFDGLTVHVAETTTSVETHAQATRDATP